MNRLRMIVKTKNVIIISNNDSILRFEKDILGYRLKAHVKKNSLKSYTHAIDYYLKDEFIKRLEHA
ncbi:unnamed protein product [marine sediment metagenome]|uniref:Uncharacterized protein n=1 Tax=marine sediment metagenome TaxID=412755 RepID=X1DWC4_9ZZZZ